MNWNCIKNKKNNWDNYKLDSLFWGFLLLSFRIKYNLFIYFFKILLYNICYYLPFFYINLSWIYSFSYSSNFREQLSVYDNSFMYLNYWLFKYFSFRQINSISHLLVILIQIVFIIMIIFIINIYHSFF